jgi:MFS transporter, MHS family, proline/betaine transporter
MSSSDTRTWNSERRRTMIGASAGNFAEWYDWGVYGVVATLLAAQFFPDGNETLALISVYGVFAASYLTRPLGAAVFGHIADSVGRRRALASTIVITCLSTALIGCIPTYEAIGYVAPLLLLVFRLIQSLGTGGEYSTAITFVYEHGRPGEKARAVAPLLAMTFVGFLVGSLLATALSAVLPASAYETWGWRVLFWLSFPMGLVGLYLRLRTEEGREFKELQEFREKRAAARRRSPVLEAVRQYWGRMLVFIGFLGTWAIISATLTNYLATFLSGNDALSSTQAYAANTLAAAMVVVLVLVYAPFADRLGLRRSAVVGSAVVALLVVPGFLLAGSGLGSAFLGAALLGAVKGVMAVPSLLAVSQIFPAGVRVTAGGLSYNISQSVLGGTAPLVAVALNDAFGSSLMFSSYLTAAALVTLVITVVCGRRWVDESADHSGDVGAHVVEPPAYSGAGAAAAK